MTARPGTTLRLHAAGDIGIVGRLADGLSERPPDFPFEAVRPRLAEADVVFGNLEIPFSGGARIVSHESPKLETPEAAAPRLAVAGFHVLSLANNHVMDFGPAGLERTLALLAEHGICTVGAGANLAESRRPVVLERHGIRVGFLAYCVPFAGSAGPDRPGAAPLEIAHVREDVAALRPRVDAVVVSVHFGMMYLEHPTPEDVDLAHAIVDAGADLVLGHHPHVLQGIETTPRGAIAYSLGEFVFDPRAGNYYARVARETRRRSIIFRADLGRDGAQVLPPLPTRAGDDLRPRPLDGEEAARALAALEELSRALHDPAMRRGFWEYAGRQLFAYEISGLWDEIRRGELRHFFSRLPRLRPRHLKLVLGYVRSALSGSGRTADSP
ncbi:MAG: CapA family protein [Candidatus Binatia bacterium]